MIIIELIQDYTHFSNNWKKGDRPTVSRELALKVMHDGIAIYIGDGCACPGKNKEKNGNS